MFARCGLLAVVALLFGAQPQARAEVGEVVLAKQFGLPYLPFLIIEDRHLVEKHATTLGRPELKVRHITLGGTAPMMDAIVSRAAHVGSGGVHAMLILWDKTKGDVKGLGGLSSYDDYLMCNDPGVKTLSDLGEKNKIALPAPKVSPQAIYLQMAAAKLWGQANFTRLDSLTIGRSHPDALAALLSKVSEINCYFSSPPYQERALRETFINKVGAATDMLGVSKLTHATAFMSSGFVEENPIAGKALVAAFQEANDIMRKDPGAAAEIYIRMSGEKDGVDNIKSIITAPGYELTDVPYAVMKNAAFLYATGLIKTNPAELGDVFLPQARIAGGS